MKILLTGASGATGGNLLRSQALNGHQLTILYHREKPIGHYLHNSEPVACNLLNADEVLRLPPDVDMIIHAAAIVPKRAMHPYEFLQNVEMARHLKSYVERSEVKNFIFISSGSVYGKNQLNKETDICEPGDAYAISMLEAEKIFLKMREPAVTVARLFYPFGFDEFTKPDNFIAKLFLKVKAGNEITVAEDAMHHHCKPLFADDLHGILKKLIENPYRGILNISGNEAITLPDLLISLASITSASLKIKTEKTIPMPYNADTSLLHTVLKNLHYTPFEQSLILTFERLQKIKLSH